MVLPPSTVEVQQFCDDEILIKYRYVIPMSSNKWIWGTRKVFECKLYYTTQDGRLGNIYFKENFSEARSRIEPITSWLETSNSEDILMTKYDKKYSFHNT